jgi:hypothetical protein
MSTSVGDERTIEAFELRPSNNDGARPSMAVHDPSEQDVFDELSASAPACVSVGSSPGARSLSVRRWTACSTAATSDAALASLLLESRRRVFDRKNPASTTEDKAPMMDLRALVGSWVALLAMCAAKATPDAWVTSST